MTAPGPAISPGVTVVVPARDAGNTLAACLGAVMPMVAAGRVQEVIVVDDGSTDATGGLAASVGAHVVRSSGAGPGGARNIGWRQAGTDLVWFLDADCVAEPNALDSLLVHLAGPRVAAVSGTYSNARPDRWNSRLIQAEIAVRHGRTSADVAMLGSYNLLCRRGALESVAGFTTTLATAEDADLSYRLRSAGWTLIREPRSVVGHFHEARPGRYFRKQAQHGYYRVLLHRQFPRLAFGDGYTGPGDVGGVIAGWMLLAGLAIVALTGSPVPCLVGAGLVIAVHAPMAWAMARIGHLPEALCFPFWAALRAAARSLGAIGALLRPPARTPRW